MTFGLKSYPAYKDSGLPWAGNVPSHWELPPNRALISQRKVIVGERHAEYPLLSLTKEGVILRDVDNGKGKFSADMGTSQEVRAGDLVFCLFDVPETPRTVGLSQHDGMITGAYSVFECADPVVAAFLNLFYRAMDDRKLLSPLYSGLRNTIPPPRLLHTKTPLPPRDEQVAIVKFLDRADRRIRLYIRSKQKLIGLLEERKRIAIHRAVARGLDPGVRLKPSGVEWLGDIPEHWEVQEIARFARIGNGSTPSRGQSAYWGGGHYPWLNSAHANLDEVCAADQFVTDVALRECHLPVVRAGSVLVGITGQGKTRGKATVLRIEATINQHLAYITPSEKKVSGDYLRLALTGAYGALRALSDDSGGTKGALTCGALKTFKVAVPPRCEQDSIVAAVNSETQVCAAAIEHARRQADLADEYRGRLIADVVTGKLDVREAAAGQKDEIEEPAVVEEEVLFEEATGLGEDSEFEEAFEEAEA